MTFRAPAHSVRDVRVDLGHGEEPLDSGDVSLLGGAEERGQDETLILPTQVNSVTKRNQTYSIASPKLRPE